MRQHSERIVGLAAIVFAAFLFTVGIPYGVTSPSNVSNIVLSPIFWPEVLAGLLALAGIGLLITARAKEPETEPENVQGGAFRLILMAILMVLYIGLTPIFGMVWTSIAAFAAMAFLIHTHHPRSALLASVLVPFILYAFFAHVAGVAIPQGDFVRLP